MTGVAASDVAMGSCEFCGLAVYPLAMWKEVLKNGVVSPSGMVESHVFTCCEDCDPDLRASREIVEEARSGVAVDMRRAYGDFIVGVIRHFRPIGGLKSAGMAW